MTSTRADIDRSIEATSAVLNALPPPKLEQVRQQVMDELDAFIRTEWLVLTPEEKRRAAARRAAAEFFHASVRVHDFSNWRAA